MLRTSVLAIALTLVIGQNSGPLCRAWCEPLAAAESGCSQHDAVATSNSRVDDVTCDMVVLSAAGLLREEPRQGVSSRGTYQASLVTRCELAHLTRAGRPSPQLRSDWSAGQRTLLTVLRL